MHVLQVSVRCHFLILCGVSEMKKRGRTAKNKTRVATAPVSSLSGELPVEYHSTWKSRYPSFLAMTGVGLGGRDILGSVEDVEKDVDCHREWLMDAGAAGVCIFCKFVHSFFPPCFQVSSFFPWERREVLKAS